MPILTIATTLVLCILIAAAPSLAKRRAWKKLTLMGLVFFGAISFALRPVCYPLTDAEVAGFSPPIEDRDETNFYGLRTFQQRDGQWHGCKMAFRYWFFG
jgi:hypothetical protein